MNSKTTKIRSVGNATGIRSLIAIGSILCSGFAVPTQAAAQMFNDVPQSHFAFDFIETLAASGITAGCGGNNYCPQAPVTRAQMAVFLERGMRGSNFGPQPASGTVFMDVGASDFAAAFIEQLAADGITAGCGNDNYCPGTEVSRAQMAVFLLRAKHGASYSPPPATGIFGDVPIGAFADAWIEQLAAEGITSGCGGGNYCPSSPVTRGQMAVFLVRTFSLPQGAVVARAFIGPEGGSLQTPDGVVVDIPPGALSESRIISVERLLEPVNLPSSFAGPVFGFRGAVDLKPDGLTFDVPVSVTVPLQEPDIPGGESFALVYRPDLDAWQETDVVAIVDPGGTTATVQLPHFSEWVLIVSGLISQPIFGAPQNTDTPQDIFDRARNRFAASVLLGDARPFDPGYNPNDDLGDVDFYNCYSVIGATFFAQFSLKSGEDPENFFDSLGSLTDSVFQMQFSRDYDYIAQAGDLTFQRIGQYDVIVYFDTVSPDASLSTGDNGLWPSQETELNAEIACKGSGMRDQEVVLELTAGGNLAGIDPLEGVTNADGIFSSALTAGASNGGQVTATATTIWSGPLANQQLVIDDTVDIEIYSLTGSWSGNGTETVTGCEDENDNGVFNGPATLTILQNGLGITGTVDISTFDGIVTPGENGEFTMTGSFDFSGDGVGTGIFTGSGSAASNTLTINWNGSDTDDTCVFSGSATASR